MKQPTKEDFDDALAQIGMEPAEIPEFQRYFFQTCLVLLEKIGGPSELEIGLEIPDPTYPHRGMRIILRWDDTIISDEDNT